MPSPNIIENFDRHEQHLVQQEQEQQFQQHFFRATNKTQAIDPSIYWHPTLAEYYLNLTPFLILSIFVALLVMTLNISIFCTTVAHLKRRVSAYYQNYSIVLCSLYPLISLAALTTILFPKSWLICHTVMHLSFAVGAVTFRALCFRYVDNEVSYLKEHNGSAISIRSPPCCCCCLCLPALVPSKAKFCVLRYMVCQLPFVQGCIMLVVNMIYFRDQALYKSVSIYFIPFIVTSILMGIWGLNITVRIVNSIKPEFNLMKRVFCLQLIMLLCKVQYLLLDSQLDHLVLGGEYPINHTIYKQTIINLLILCEMVLVSMLVQNAYKVIPSKQETLETTNVKTDCDINYNFK